MKTLGKWLTSMMPLLVVALVLFTGVLARANLDATRQRAAMLSEMRAMTARVEKLEAQSKEHAAMLEQASANDKTFDERDKMIALVLEKITEAIVKQREAIRKLQRGGQNWL